MEVVMERKIISDPSAYVNMIGEYARKRTYF